MKGPVVRQSGRSQNNDHSRQKCPYYSSDGPKWAANKSTAEDYSVKFINGVAPRLIESTLMIDES